MIHEGVHCSTFFLISIFRQFREYHLPGRFHCICLLSRFACRNPLTLRLSLECSVHSKFHLQLCTDVERRQECEENTPNLTVKRPIDCINFVLWKNAVSHYLIFFGTNIFIHILNHWAMGFAWGFNKFIWLVDLHHHIFESVDHLWRPHLQWSSRSMLITCGCPNLIELNQPIINDFGRCGLCVINVNSALISSGDFAFQMELPKLGFLNCIMRTQTISNIRYIFLLFSHLKLLF